MSDNNNLPAGVPEAEVQEIRGEAAKLVDYANALVVTDEATYQESMEFAKACTKSIRTIEERFEPAKTSAHKAWKAICEMITDLTKPRTQAKTLAEAKASKWYRDENARRAREAEELRQAEVKRQEEERLALAATLAKGGATAAADAVLDEPVVVATPKPVPITVDNTTMRECWDIEVADLMALVKAVAEGKAPITYLVANESALRQSAKALKKMFNVPGVRAFDKGSIAYKR